MYACMCTIMCIMLYGIIHVGFLWSGRPRVCCYTVGTDNHEVWVRWAIVLLWNTEQILCELNGMHTGSFLGRGMHTHLSSACTCRYRLGLLSTKYCTASWKVMYIALHIYQHDHWTHSGLAPRISLFVFGLKIIFFFFGGVRLSSFNVSFAGKISLDNVFQERERLNHNIVGEEVF